MKTLKLLTIAFVAFFASCSSDDDTTPIDELQNLAKVTELSNDTHVIELYTQTGTLVQGHNPVSIRIKDKSTGNFQTDAAISWMPIMHMTTMQHSCPFSDVTKTPGAQTLYDGYIVFQMPENASEYWTLNLTYTIDGTEFSATGTIPVLPSDKKRVASFTGSDGGHYVIALADPTQPTVGLNAMSAYVYKMGSMMSYVPVDNLTIKIDPRMPAMGNHSSPNNVDLTQVSNRYQGTLSLTMSGYWKINLQVVDENNNVLKGEAVTAENPSSSLYFEVEF